ncbi:uncharacterized protein [Argopecten irradians]|uniref:uncharacterized protein n=1 Tax=Argopecten irradians TaxID=31199 RepID=UPI0037163526
MFGECSDSGHIVPHVENFGRTFSSNLMFGECSDSSSLKMPANNPGRTPQVSNIDAPRANPQSITSPNMERQQPRVTQQKAKQQMQLPLSPIINESASSMQNNSAYHYNTIMDDTNNEDSTIIYSDSRLSYKKLELLEIIENDKPDIICLTEIFPKHTSLHLDEDSYHLRNYTTNISTVSHRGVVIYTRDTLNAEKTDQHIPFQEYTTISVKLNEKDELLICCVYRSPNSPEDNNKHLNELIDSLGNTKCYSHILLLGDFNYKEIDWKNQISLSGLNNPATKFLEATRDNFLIQHVTSPTRYRVNQTPSTLDLIFTNEEEMIRDISYESGLGKSDHLSLQFRLYCYKETPLENQTSTHRNFFKGQYTEIKSNLAKIDCNRLDSIQDVDVAWNSLTVHFNYIIEKFIPVSKGRNTNKPQNRELSHEAKSAIRAKNRRWIKYLHCKTEDNFILYKSARNIATKQIRSSKYNYEKDLAGKIKTNPKLFWSHVKSKSRVKSTIGEIKKNKWRTINQ